MSEETWLYAGLMAASADSTSPGGAVPGISEGAGVMPWGAGDVEHSWSMWSLMWRRFLRGSLIDTPIAAVAASGVASRDSAETLATAGASKLAIRSRRIEMK